MSDSEKKSKKYVIVDAVSTFHMRYVVELNENDPEHFAHDTVVMGEAKEFSQKHLDETIVTSREVDKEEVLSIARKDNPEWSMRKDDELLNAFVTTQKQLNDDKYKNKSKM